MPFKLVKVGGGYKVFSPSGGKSKKPLSHARALAQLRAIYANWHGDTKSPSRKRLKSSRLTQTRTWHGRWSQAIKKRRIVKKPLMTLRVKAYNAGQPRWPKGSPAGGEWRGKVGGRIRRNEFVPVDSLIHLGGVLSPNVGNIAGSVGVYTGIRAGIAAVRALHKARPDWGEITVKMPRSRGGAGGDISGSYFRGGGVRDRIEIYRNVTKNPGLTFLHEFGHYIDYNANTWNHPRIVDVMKVASKGQSFKYLRAIADKGVAVIGGKQFHFGRQSWGKYMLQRQEVWARAYAQYVVTRRGSLRLHRELRRMQNDPLSGYWSNREFRQIAKYMDEIFRDRGLT